MKPVKLGIVGDTSKLSPELREMLPGLLRDIEKMLNADHTELRKKYLEGKIELIKAHDWYSAMSLK